MSALDGLLNIIGARAAVGAGTVLPLMALIFGSFVAKFSDFSAGETTADAFQADVDSFT
jgi:ATP-binding cassette subfamily B (MDR/TAP) protein 1